MTDPKDFVYLIQDAALSRAWAIAMTPPESEHHPNCEGGEYCSCADRETSKP